MGTGGWGARFIYISIDYKFHWDERCIRNSQVSNINNITFLLSIIIKHPLEALENCSSPFQIYEFVLLCNMIYIIALHCLASRFSLTVCIRQIEMLCSHSRSISLLAHQLNRFEGAGYKCACHSLCEMSVSSSQYRAHIHSDDARLFSFFLLLFFLFCAISFYILFFGLLLLGYFFVLSLY